MDDDLDDLLEELGLTQYQSRAYVAAIRLGTSSLPDLAEEADIPQQRIYDVVDDLQRRGFVEVQEGSGGKQAVAVPPEDSLGELKRQRIDQLEATVDTAIEELSSRFGQVDASSGFVTVVNHASSVKRHVRTAVEDASWWLFCSLPADWIPEFESDLASAVDRGVTVRLLVQGEDATLEADAYPEGALVRHRPSADLVVASDREYGVFRGVGASVVDRPTLVTRDRNIVAMFQRYSEQFWTGSRALRTEQPYPRRYLEPWRALVEHVDAIDAGEPLAVTVEGTETDSGRRGTWTGPIVDYTLEAERSPDYSVVLPEVAQLVVETDDGEVTVGGWDATLEDVAATGLEIRRE